VPLRGGKENGAISPQQRFYGAINMTSGMPAQRSQQYTFSLILNAPTA